LAAFTAVLALKASMTERAMRAEAVESLVLAHKGYASERHLSPLYPLSPRIDSSS